MVLSALFLGSMGGATTLRSYNSHTHSSKISFIEFPFFPTFPPGFKSLFLERFFQHCGTFLVGGT